MTRNAKKTFACILALAMTLSLFVPAFAVNGPYKPEGEEDWNYARLELVELDENENPISVLNEEYGYPEQKSLPLYTNGAATAQEGAVYDPAANTLTITDLKGNYILRVNLMGDDFTLCVKGECSLTRIEVHGGGVIQPKWSCALRITGDGTLNVNPKILDSGIFFAPQEEAESTLTVDPDVTLNVSGTIGAIEAWGYTGVFSINAAAEIPTIEPVTAVREVELRTPGYTNLMKMNIPLCVNAADKDGIYAINSWLRYDGTEYVTVERYVYNAKHDLYLKDVDWEQANDREGTLNFDTLEDAAAAGFTVKKDDQGFDCWLDDVNVLADYNDVQIREAADGARYGVSYGYVDGEFVDEIAMTMEEIDELPGKYMFIYAPDVDPENLTEVHITQTFEGQYDYMYPEKEFSSGPAQQTCAHNLVKTEAKAASCTEDGNVEYFTCTVCGKIFADEAAETELTETALKAAGHKLEKVEAKPATAAEAGNIEHYRCTVCGKLFADADALQELTPEETVIDKLPAFMLGDVDRDTKISAGDARLALRRSVGLETYAEGSVEFLACDVDKDGKVTAGDARSILRASVGLDNPADW